MSEPAIILGTFPPTTTGELAGGSPGGTAVTDYEGYYRWLDSGLQSLPDVAHELPPAFMGERPWQLIYEVGVLLEGNITFASQDSSKSFTDFEYQLPGMTGFATCSDWLVGIPNRSLSGGSVLIRAKASATKGASSSISNRATLAACVPPLTIRSIGGKAYTGDLGTIYYATNKVVRFEVEVPVNCVVRVDHSNISTLGYYPQHAVPAGISFFEQDISNLPPPQRRLYLTVQGFPDYSTRKVIVNFAS